MTTRQIASLYKEESCGSSYGWFQIEINVGAANLPSLENESIRIAAYDAVKLIKSAVLAEVIKNNPESIKRASEEKAKLLDLFPGAPFVEEIPNGYCPDCCCKHLPWFVVTTCVGRIKIGWRKSVINIDWSDTHRTKNSHELFEHEAVTKFGRGIHAWSYEDAKRYIDTIIASGTA